MANNVKPSTPLFWKPVDTRRSTDTFFSLLTLLCLFLWLGIIILQKFGHENSQLHTLKWLGIEYLTCGVTAISVIILCLTLLYLLKDNWLVFVITFFIVIIILALIACIFCALFFHTSLGLPYTLFILTILGVTLIYNVTIYICTRELGVASLGPMIKEPIRAIVRSFPTLVCSILIIFLSTIVSTTTSTIIYTNMFYNIFDTNFTKFSSDSLILYLLALVSVYVTNFIWNLGYMIMGDYFANYYDQQNVSWTYVFRSVSTVLRYHLGTVTFLSIPILPWICAAIMTFKNNQQPGKQSDYKLINFFSKISLIMNISEYALIQTSIYGSKTLNSIRQMVDLQRSNPSLFLTLNTVPLKIMDLILVIIMIIGFFAARLVGFNIFSIMNDTGTLFISINTLLVRPATCTFTIYKMIHDQQELNSLDEQCELNTEQ